MDRREDEHMRGSVFFPLPHFGLGLLYFIVASYRVDYGKVIKMTLVTWHSKCLHYVYFEGFNVYRIFIA